MDIKKYAPLINGIVVVLVFTVFHFISEHKAKRAEFRAFESWVESEILLYIRLNACKKAEVFAECADKELSYFKKNIDELVAIAEREAPDDRLKDVIARYRALEVK